MRSIELASHSLHMDARITGTLPRELVTVTARATEMFGLWDHTQLDEVLRDMNEEDEEAWEEVWRRLFPIGWAEVMGYDPDSDEEF